MLRNKLYDLQLEEQRAANAARRQSQVQDPSVYGHTHRLRHRHRQTQTQTQTQTQERHGRRALVRASAGTRCR
jgi:hypothetical protein